MPAINQFLLSVIVVEFKLFGLTPTIYNIKCVCTSCRCEVGIQEVAKDSALGRLKGSDNVVSIVCMFIHFELSHIYNSFSPQFPPSP